MDVPVGKFRASGHFAALVDGVGDGVAATERAGQRSVIFTDLGSEPIAITRIRVFSEAG